MHLPTLRCNRCGHSWYPRVPREPVVGFTAKGYDCFPCCDNVDEHGHCLGFEETEE